jgi:two-component system, LytTR family, response regulator
MKDVVICAGDGLMHLQIQDIVRIQSIGSYSKIFFSGNRYPITVARVLKRLQQELPEALFIRPHRTHLVNKNFISHIRTMGGQSCLLLQNGESITISRRKITAVRKKTGAVLTKN